MGTSGLVSRPACCDCCERSRPCADHAVVTRPHAWRHTPWETFAVLVEVAVLGELRVTVDGVDVTLRAAKTRTLFSLLAVNRSHVVGVDRLLEELWPDLPPDRGRHVLQVRIA